MKDVPSAAAKAEMLVVWRGEPKALLGADWMDGLLVDVRAVPWALRRVAK